MEKSYERFIDNEKITRWMSETAAIRIKMDIKKARERKTELET